MVWWSGGNLNILNVENVNLGSKNLNYLYKKLNSINCNFFKFKISVNIRPGLRH